MSGYQGARCRVLPTA